MKHRRASALALAVTLAAAAAPAVAAPVSLGADDIGRLSRGDVVIRIRDDDSGVADAILEAAIDIPAAPSHVFALMTDCGRAPKFVEGLTSCRVLEVSKDGLSDVREHRIRWLAILPEIVSVFRSTYVPDQEIQFEKAGGDLRHLEGSWHLEARNTATATRLTYFARIGLDLQLPSFLVRSAAERDMAASLRALRDEAVAPP